MIEDEMNKLYSSKSDQGDLMKLGSLFDGIGGWLLAAKHAGVTPVWQVRLMISLPQ